jgi:hypothetical protein
MLMRQTEKSSAATDQGSKEEHLTLNIEIIRELKPEDLSSVSGADRALELNVCGAICTSNGTCEGNTWV